MAASPSTSPASSGPAGPLFEGQVAAYYLLSLLTDTPPRGLPATTIDRIELQRASEGHPLDDVVVHAHDAQARPAVLAIQVKRSITFAPSDPVFRAAVAQIAATLRQPDFWSSRYELAIAIARTTQKIDGAYQDVLAWARTLGSAATFFDRIERPGSANDDMRTFVRTFRSHLNSFDVPSDDETIWKLLGRLQILTFDFTAPGSATEELMRERSASALHPDDSAQAASLWSNLTELSMRIGATGGDRTRDRLIQDLHERSFRLAGVHHFSSARARLREDASHALADISDQVGSVALTRHHRLAAVREALDLGRYVEIRGEAGVGKSAVLKHLAQQVARESPIIVLSPNRTTPHGWSALRTALRFDGSAHELLTDLAAAGGAFLFIDGLENFSEVEQKTAIDLVREAADVPGFSVVTTARHGFAKEDPSWLPEDAVHRLGRTAPVILGELSESEIAEIRGAAPHLSTLLSDSHPARDVIRNLYRLARLSALPASEPVPPTETDMAQQWWASADGKKDNGHRDRARLLRALAEQALLLEQPLSVTGYPSAAVDALIRSETLRDLQGDRVAFRHDVLREWAVASLQNSDPAALARLPLERPAPVWLARSVELTARMAIEHAPDDAAWHAVIERVSHPKTHGSWRRAVLLSLVRSEAAMSVLHRVSSRLLADRGHLLRELIRTVMAVEIEPLAESRLAADVDPKTIPAVFQAPSGPSWFRLIVWIIALPKEKLPPAAISAVADLYSGWCIGNLGRDPVTPVLLSFLYLWLMEIEKTREPGCARQRRELFGGGLQAHQVRALEQSLRGTFVLFAKHVPELAAQYLQYLLQRNPEDPAVDSVLKFRGTLAQAAPAQLAQLTAAALIPRPTDSSSRTPRRRSDLSGPFGFADHRFLPASPAQGPFYELLVNAPDHGLALIRQLVDHAISFYSDNRAYGSDVIPLVFTSGERRFPWKRSYFWTRDEVGHNCVTSALMALEAWSHARIESGATFEIVLADVLGSDEVPAAYLLVAVDLLLSHWPQSSEAAIPFLASPELLCLDRQRVLYDSVQQPDPFGLRALEKEPHGASSVEALRQRPSRRHLLDRLLGQYAVGGASHAREKLRELLQQASARLGPPAPDSNLGHPAFMVLHALNLIEPGNWTEVTLPLKSGGSTQGYEYIAPTSETEHLKPQQEAALGRQRDASFEAALGLALDHPERSSPDLAAAGVTWAQGVPQASSENDNGTDAQWMREQAIFAAALILARDGTAELRAQHADWARQVFERALQTEEDPGRSVRSGVRFNPIAIAFVGLAHLLRDRAESRDIRALLEIAAREEPAGAHGFAATNVMLAKIDERLPRAILRCAFSACIRARQWDASAEVEAELDERYRQKQNAVVDAELAWLSGEAEDPAWPHFPDEPLRVRSSPRGAQPQRNAPARPPHGTEERVNDRAAAIWLRAATRHDWATAPWMCELIKTYSVWTFAVNGVDLARDDELEHRRDAWNDAYFELLGACLSDCSLAVGAVESMSRLPDEPFFDVLPTFLRALDEVYFNKEGIDTTQIVEVRARLADRLAASWRWTQLRASTSDGIDMHLGPAIAALFFNSFHPFTAPPRCYLNPPAIECLDPFLPMLRKLASTNPCLFVALVTLNLLEVAPRAVQLSLLLVAADAWLEAYRDDTVFWLDKDIGNRVCAVIDRAWRADPSAFQRDEAVFRRIEGLLASLIRLGISEAVLLERKLSLS